MKNSQPLGDIDHSVDYSSSSQLIHTEAECMAHWREHFSQLLNAAPNCLDPYIKATAELTHSAQNDPGELTIDEIHRDVKKLKVSQAAGICGIPAGLLKNTGPVILLWLQTLFNIIWRTELVLSNWQKDIILPLWKHKGSKQDCCNSRSITCLSIPGKVLASVLLAHATDILRSKRRPQ